MERSDDLVLQAVRNDQLLTTIDQGVEDSKFIPKGSLADENATTAAMPAVLRTPEEFAHHGISQSVRVYPLFAQGWLNGVYLTRACVKRDRLFFQSDGS